MRTFAAGGVFWVLSLYLEMLEQIGRTQRSGKYCRNVSRWIPCTWKGDIRTIFELPVGVSVAKVVAGAKNGIFGQRCRVLSTKYWCYGVPTLIDVRDDPTVSVCMLGLTMVALVVVEIWGEIFPHSVICAIFEIGGGKTGNSFVRSGGLIL